MRADLQHTLRVNNTLRRKKLLRQYAGKIARCHSGRYGRVTNVEIDAKGRPVFIGWHVDPPGTVYLSGKTTDWTEWKIRWQSVKPKWIT